MKKKELFQRIKLLSRNQVIAIIQLLNIKKRINNENAAFISSYIFFFPIYNFIAIFYSFNYVILLCTFEIII